MDLYKIKFSFNIYPIYVCHGKRKEFSGATKNVKFYMNSLIDLESNQLRGKYNIQREGTVNHFAGSTRLCNRIIYVTSIHLIYGICSWDIRKGSLMELRKFSKMNYYLMNYKDIYLPCHWFTLFYYIFNFVLVNIC